MSLHACHHDYNQDLIDAAVITELIDVGKGDKTT